jgi:rubrerythrin
VREVFEKFTASERKGWKSQNSDVYEHAMQLEKESYELYQKLHNTATTAAGRDFFKALMDMENGHHAALQNVHFYLTDTADYNHESESASGWNWMTL